MSKEKAIWVINGTGGCGKDTFIEFVSKYAKVRNISSIDKVKEVAKVIGWNGEKNDKSRKFLSDLKALTTEYNDMAFNDIAEKTEEFKNSDDEILFIHIREIENIERAVNEFGAKALLIKRDGLENISSNRSDADVDKYDYDQTINNTTLEEFENEAKKFAEENK